MATRFQLRRDILGVDPVTGDLQEGELGYAYASDKLFIGGPAAGSVLQIGGASVIALLTTTPGVATADKAVILDSNTKIDIWNVVGQVEADTFKTSATVNAGFVKNDGSGNLLFGQTGEQTDFFLDNLADVDTTNIATGKHLIFDGTNWVPVANDLIGLADTPPDYSGSSLLFLRVDSGTAFVEFVSIGLSDLPAIALDDLSDVSLTSSGLGEFLRNDGAGQFVNVTLTDTDIPDDLTLGTVTGNVAFTGNILPGADVIMTTTTAAFYLGDPLTNGSWRIMRDIGGTEDLLIQERVSNSWVTKGSFST